jgi:acetyltransferase
MSGLRAAARLKPVVVVKAGRHPAGTRAIKSHTGAWVGSADVFRAVMERAGWCRWRHLDQLFAAAQVFGTGKRLGGERIAIITNGGGPGVLAADRAQELGLTLASALARPPARSWRRPCRITGPTATRWTSSATPPPSATGGGGRLPGGPGGGRGPVHPGPAGLRGPHGTAEQVIEAAKKTKKPVLACWMGGNRVAEAQALFAEHRVPHFETPEIAVEAMSFLANHQRNQQLLMQSPGPCPTRRPRTWRGPGSSSRG